MFNKTIMFRLATSTLVIILVVSLQFGSQLVMSQRPSTPTFGRALCRNDDFGSYKTNSPYEINLKNVLFDLADHASSALFHNISAGTGSSTVYGQYYCRGDISLDFCRQCVEAASEKALNCSNAKAAIVWHNECTLQYKKDSLYGVIENNLVLNSYSRLNLTTPNNFSVVLNETVRGLIKEAVANESGLATAERPVETLIPLTAYFLVQCGADLNRRQCESCLDMAFNETRTCCGEWPIILYTFTSSCQVMYNAAALFYFTPGAPAPPPPVSVSSEPPQTDQVTVTPPSSSTSTGGSAKLGSNESMKLRIISIALVVWVLVLHT